MKALFLALILLLAPKITAAEKPGHFKNATGTVQVEMKVTVNSFGDQTVELCKGGKCNDAPGIPVPNSDPDDVGETTHNITVDGDKFRVENGTLQWLNPQQRWIDLAPDQNPPVPDPSNPAKPESPGPRGPSTPKPPKQVHPLGWRDATGTYF